MLPAPSEILPRARREPRLAGGLIPQSFIQDLLARTDIVEVVGSRLELKRAGREFKALSPFSHEKTPSFYVSPAKQFFHCFSSGKHGNAIGFLMEYDRLSFIEAVEELAKQAGLEVPREGGSAERLVLDGPLDALAAAQRFFRDQLREAPAAIDYLKQRGVNPETAKRFGIGYAPDAWDRLTRFFDDPRHAIAAGLLIERDEERGNARGRCYDRFRNRVMFPIRDTRGRVIAFGGRALGDDPAKYLNSPETPLFHKGRNLFGLYEAKQATRSALAQLIVVEGYMDVVMLSQHGITEVVATLGTATTREHLQLLYKSAPRVVFCFDGDRAGRGAAWRALEQALPEAHGGRECLFMFLPEGQDPDSFVQQVGADEFRARIAQAQTLSGFLLGELAQQVNLGTLDGRARLAALARPYLDKLPEGPLRRLILNELARLTRLRVEDLAGAAAAVAAADDALPELAGGDAAAVAALRIARPVRRALQLLLERPDLADGVTQLELLAQADVPGLPLLLATIDYFREHPGASAALLVEDRRGTAEGELLQQLGGRSELDRPDLGATLSERIGDAGIEEEFVDIIARLHRGALEARYQSLLGQSQLRELSSAELAEMLVLQRELRQRRR